MVQHDADWNGETFEGVELLPEEVRGAEVRFRYRVAADQRDAARAAAEGVRQMIVDVGAVHVKVEEVVRPTGTARAPEVAQAATLPDKLAALWRARGTTPAAERLEALLGKAHLLEENHAL
jgi:hypothetical protein